MHTPRCDVTRSCLPDSLSLTGSPDAAAADTQVAIMTDLRADSSLSSSSSLSLQTACRRPIGNREIRVKTLTLHIPRAIEQDVGRDIGYLRVQRRATRRETAHKARHKPTRNFPESPTSTTDRRRAQMTTRRQIKPTGNTCDNVRMMIAGVRRQMRVRPCYNNRVTRSAIVGCLLLVTSSVCLRFG